MQGNAIPLLSPARQLFLLARGWRFPNPDENILTGEHFRARRFERLRQHVNIPALLRQTPAFQPKTCPVFTLP